MLEPEEEILQTHGLVAAATYHKGQSTLRLPVHNMGKEEITLPEGTKVAQAWMIERLDPDSITSITDSEQPERTLPSYLEELVKHQLLTDPQRESLKQMLIRHQQTFAGERMR